MSTSCFTPTLGALLIAMALSATASQAQAPTEPNWLDPTLPTVQVSTTQDGTYLIRGAELIAQDARFAGHPVANLHLHTYGASQPLLVRSASASLGMGDSLIFAGERFLGEDEQWAYENYDRPSIVGTLYSDTTHYWISARPTPGLHYTLQPGATLSNPARFVSTSRLDDDNSYFAGISSSAGDPRYTQAEGYYRARYAGGNSALFTVVDLGAPAEDSVYVDVRMVGGSGADHAVTVSVEGPASNGGWTSPLKTVADVPFAQYDDVTVRVGVAAPAGATQLRVSTRTAIAPTSIISYAYVDLYRTQTLLSSVPEGARRVSVTTPGAATLPTQTRFALMPGARAAALGGAASRTFDALGGDLFTASAGALQAPVAMRSYSGFKIDDPSRQVDYLIVTTPALRPSAEAFATYREASGYRVLIVNQSDVFAQYDGGNQRPIALRRLLHQTQAWQHPPEFFLLWGDALLPTRNRTLQPWEVISFGNSVSDSWFGMQRGGVTDWSEVASIGRIPVRTNDEGDRYIAKLARYESAPSAAWPRRSLFASGGYSAGQVATLESYANSWATTALTAPTAFDTTRIVKRGLEPVNGAWEDQITRIINEGIGWLAFFGHSSTQVWEITTEPPSTLQNTVALPLILSFGCQTGAFAIGDAETHTLSLSEQYVTGAAGGGIAHWGSSATSTVSAGGYLGSQVHELFLRDTSRVLGPTFREAKRRMAAFTSGGTNARNLLQYGLIGDPATRLQLATKPNLVSQSRDIRPATATPALSDSTLALTVRLRNWGLRLVDSTTVTLTHMPPGAATRTLSARVGPFSDSIDVAFTLPLTDTQAGTHVIGVTTDADGSVAESDETDNSSQRTVTISGSALQVAFQAESRFYGTPPNLLITRASLAADTVNVRFQVDTDPTFTSAALQERTVQVTRLGEFVPDGLTRDARYYWQALNVDDPFANPVGGTFVYAPDAGRTGWLSVPAEAVGPSDTVDQTADGLAFPKRQLDILVSSERGQSEYRGQINVGDESLVTQNLGWGFVVVDGKTGAVKYSTGHLATYDLPTGLEARLGTNRELAIARLDSLASGLYVDFEDGDIILGRTRNVGYTRINPIEDEVKASLRALGSQAADTLSYLDMWQLYYRVGYPDQRYEAVISPSSVTEVRWDTTLVFREPTAQLTSSAIGPALSFGDAGFALDVPDGVAATLAVLDAQDGRTLLTSPATSGTTRLDLSAVSPDSRVRLQATFEDSRPYVPGVEDGSGVGIGDFSQWFVAYDPVPRLLLEAPELAPAPLQEGEVLTFSIPIRNLTLSTASDVRMAYYLTAQSGDERLVRVDTLGAIAPNARIDAMLTLPTLGLTGSNRLRAEVRHAYGDATDGSALTTFTVGFEVTGDQTPPTYAIRIDGETFDPDPNPVANLQDARFPFVSATPTIEIQVEDGNAFRPLTDSSIVTLSLNGKRVSLSDPDVAFSPAGDDGQARIVYTPDLSRSDSTYTLVLRAFDASGNEARDSPYQVHFRVQTELEVEAVLPYPNPMTDATTFAFRVKGADATDLVEARLRIFTVTGQVVREFDVIERPDLLDAGTVRIGWNKMRWDGTDADGDRIGPGVYLYRVFLRGADGTVGQTNVERIAVVR